MQQLRTVVCGLLAALVVCCPSLALAQSTVDVPHTISYQGLLVNRDGFPLPDGDHTLHIRLYADSDGVAGIWQSDVRIRTRNGIFNAILGTPFTDPLPPIEELGKPLWLGVQVDGHMEMRPLTPVTGTLYALTVADNSIATQKIQDSAVTTVKIAPDFVGHVYLNGTKASNKAGGVNFVLGRQLRGTVDTTDPNMVQVRLNFLDSTTVIPLQIVPGAGIRLTTDTLGGIQYDTIAVDSLGIKEWMLDNQAVSSRALADNAVSSIKILDHEVHGVDINRDIAGYGLHYDSLRNNLNVLVGPGLVIDSGSGAVNLDMKWIVNNLKGKIGVNPDTTRGIDTVNNQVFAKVDHATIGFNSSGEITLILSPGMIHGIHLNPDVADDKTIELNPETHRLQVKKGGIGSNELADSSVISSKIATGAVDSRIIAANSVDSTRLIDSSIAFNDLAPSTVEQLRRVTTNNRYEQATSLSPVVGKQDSTGVLQAVTTDPSNNNPVVSATSISTNGGVLFKGNATGSNNGAALMQLQLRGTDRFVVGNGGNTTVTTATGTGLSVTTTSPNAGDAAIKATASAPGTTAIVASGSGADSTGALNAVALELNNGGIRVTGTTKPVGTATATIPAGRRSVVFNVKNPFAQPTSIITFVLTGVGGSINDGTDHDTFSGVIRAKNNGSFDIEVSCNQGDAPSDEAVNIEFTIINQ